jgi:hypothetical protein
MGYNALDCGGIAQVGLLHLNIVAKVGQPKYTGATNTPDSVLALLHEQLGQMASNKAINACDENMH